MTFDKKKYNFQGDCDYTLVKDCLNNTFHLWSDNELRRPSDKVSFIRAVTLEMNGNVYSLNKGLSVRVNGIEVSQNLPYVDANVWINRDVTKLVSTVREPIFSRKRNSAPQSILEKPIEVYYLDK